MWLNFFDIDVNDWKFLTKVKLFFARLLVETELVYKQDQMQFKAILVFHDAHFCQIIWQISSYTKQNKFRQKLPPVRYEPTTSWPSLQCWVKSLFGCLCESLSYALLILEMNEVQNVKWCMKQSSLQKSSAQHTTA